MRRKAVKLPADYLTAGQRKELNGMAVTYSMDKPHTYLELLAFPKDIRKEYLEGIKQKYKPSLADLTKMLHTKKENVQSMLKSLDVEWTRTYKSPTEQFNWRVFLGENITPPEPEPEPKPVLKPIPKPAVYAEIDHVALHLKGYPFSIAGTLTQMLDPNKQYYYSINIQEIYDRKEETIESCSSGTGEACDLEGAS